MHPATLAYQEQAHFSSEIEVGAQLLRVLRHILQQCAHLDMVSTLQCCFRAGPMYQQGLESACHGQAVHLAGGLVLLWLSLRCCLSEGCPCRLSGHVWAVCSWHLPVCSQPCRFEWASAQSPNHGYVWEMSCYVHGRSLLSQLLQGPIGCIDHQQPQQQHNCALVRTGWRSRRSSSHQVLRRRLHRRWLPPPLQTLTSTRGWTCGITRCWLGSVDPIAAHGICPAAMRCTCASMHCIRPIRAWLMRTAAHAERMHCPLGNCLQASAACRTVWQAATAAHARQP